MATDPNSAPASKGPAMVGTSIGFLAIAWLTVLLRFWVRQVMLRSLGVDDWLMGFALVLFTLYCTFLIVEVGLGGGSHLSSSIPLDNLQKLFKYVLLSETFYILTMVVFKISLGVFFLRIVVRAWHAIFIYMVMLISTTFGIAYFFVALWQCGNPVNILENKLAGHCQSASAILGMGYTHAAVQAFTDWSFAILPVIILWNANIDLRSKFSVGFILMLGAAGSTATLVRFKFEKGLTNDEEFFFAAGNLAITTTIEAGLGITAASLATLKPLFKCCCYRLRSTLASDQKNRYGEQTSPYGTNVKRTTSNLDGGRAFRPYDNTVEMDRINGGNKTTVIGNNRSSPSSSEEDINLEHMVPRDQSLGDPLSAKPASNEWKTQNTLIGPNRSWYKIEKTTNVQVTNEIWPDQESV